ncbi:hypothetical protein CASFOL_003338 [Castilleja foliolosa]|uniref:Transmembrane protein n=1 Tax=Castilleja foliolosa TaxID=1961234 RepID=A0ABD3EGV9_9LAMI
MDSRIKGSLVISLLLLVLLSPGILKASCNGTNRLDLLHKEGYGANSRKLLQVDIVFDYGDAGPNPKHDPRRKGGGGKNP